MFVHQLKILIIARISYFSKIKRIKQPQQNNRILIIIIIILYHPYSINFNCKLRHVKEIICHKLKLVAINFSAKQQQIYHKAAIYLKIDLIFQTSYSISVIF